MAEFPKHGHIVVMDTVVAARKGNREGRRRKGRGTYDRRNQPVKRDPSQVRMQGCRRDFAEMMAMW
jgi:hypothetical protein